MDANSLQTNLGNPKTYGLLGSMGYMGYGYKGVECIIGFQDDARHGSFRFAVR